MALTKHKLKKQMMEKTLNSATDKESKKKKELPEVLPYFKLDFGQKMEILLLAYEDGELMRHIKKHGPNMGNSAAGSIECIYHARGESCPACAEGFSHVKDGKGTPESKKWMAKDYYVAQCVVIESPFDIEPLEDGNQVRIFYMPFAVMEKIKESYAEGIVEDPTENVFVIKKSKNQGGNASYANSYFRPEPAGEEIYEAFEDEKVELHDLYELEIQPKEATEEEVEEWTAKAVKLLEKESKSTGSRGAKTSRSSSDDGDDGKHDSKDDSSDSDDSSDDSSSSSTTSDNSAGSKGLSLKERLKRSRGN